MTTPIRVLIVDDNRQYREAFRRNLILEGFQVLEAEHADRAMEILKTQTADVLVTDLQMRTQTEGLSLIRDTRAVFPCLPIIMISAVGTFDEGAMASKMGAAYVLGKARIDEEISVLHDCIRQSHAAYQITQKNLEEISRIQTTAENAEFNADAAINRLREIMGDPSVDAYVKGEAFDVLTNLTQAQLRQRSQTDIDQALASSVETQEEAMKKVNDELTRLVPALNRLHEDTRDTLRTAEFFFQNMERLGPQFDFSRGICFSYCFSVENQTKINLRKRLTKFLGEPGTADLIRNLLEKPSNHVSLFFHQYILQTMRDRAMDFTIDNVRQTFLRILEHASKYRPDGLKALGIIVLVFGRTYEFKQFNKTVRVDNPFGMKGLSSDAEVIRLAELLVNLQHYRNPYIHPEISDRQALSKIRDTSIECLNLVMRLE